jgi:hypothetical protein
MGEDDSTSVKFLLLLVSGKIPKTERLRSVTGCQQASVIEPAQGRGLALLV